MSLQNIQLPSFLIPDLYKKTLVEQKISEEPGSNEQTSAFKYLGGNARQIALVVKNAEAIYLTDDQLKFVTGILDACKLNIGDVALINIEKNSVTYNEITQHLNAKIILLFGVHPSQIQLPFNIPEFQKQSFNNQLYLLVPALHVLKNDKELKRKLWTSLQQIFSL